MATRVRFIFNINFLLYTLVQLTRKTAGDTDCLDCSLRALWLMMLVSGRKLQTESTASFINLLLFSAKHIKHIAFGNIYSFGVYFVLKFHTKCVLTNHLCKTELGK